MMQSLMYVLTEYHRLRPIGVFRSERAAINAARSIWTKVNVSEEESGGKQLDCFWNGNKQCTWYLTRIAPGVFAKDVHSLYLRRLEIAPPENEVTDQ